MSTQPITTLASLAITTLHVMIVLNVRGLIAFPSGAPPDTCSTNLLPIHGGHQPSTDAAPYVLTASSGSYSPNKQINVVIKGLPGNAFKGFVIQAQDAISGEPINSGEWSSGSAKELPCAAATHISPIPKTKVELTWTPKGSGRVQFVATVVESFDTFYSDIKSIVRSSAAGASSATTSTGQRQKPSRPNSNSHRDNGAQDNLPFNSPSFSASQSKDDSNADQSGGGTSSFFPSSSFGSQPLTGSPSFTVEDQDHMGGNPHNFFPHPALRPPQMGGGGPFPGGFHHGLKPDERQQESSQVFARFPSNNNMHRFAPPQEPPAPFMRAPWHLPRPLI